MSTTVTTIDGTTFEVPDGYTPNPELVVNGEPLSWNGPEVKGEGWEVRGVHDEQGRLLSILAEGDESPGVLTAENARALAAAILAELAK